MKDYYEILGLQPGALEHEIKRAYFKQVRTYTPEADPEKFKEIREAYEYLKDERNRADYAEDTREIPEDPWARKLLEQMKMCMKGRSYYRGMETAEEALCHFPEGKIFQFYLALFQRKLGYTGKAVKNCEQLVSQEPDNIRYAKEMALSYAARGYRKKALEAFEKTYDRGCRDLDFILEYSLCCDESSLWERGRALLLDIVEQNCKWTKDDVCSLLDVYAGLFQFDFRCAKDDTPRIVGCFGDFICKYALNMEEEYSVLEQVFCSMLDMTDVSLGPDIRRRLAAGCDALEQVYISKEAKESLERMKSALSGICVMGSDRLGAAIKNGWEFYVDFEACCRWEDEEEKRYIRKYAELDCQLCMLDEMPGILEEFELLRELSPEYYSKLSGFIHTLKTSSNLSYLKSKLLKEYQRLSENVHGGHYYELHPEERRTETVWNEDTPYKRPEKKVGRNDPCPCGSGKKYKHCCGR